MAIHQTVRLDSATMEPGPNLELRGRRHGAARAWHADGSRSPGHGTPGEDHEGKNRERKHRLVADGLGPGRFPGTARLTDDARQAALGKARQDVGAAREDVARLALDAERVGVAAAGSARRDRVRGGSCGRADFPSPGSVWSGRSPLPAAVMVKSVEPRPPTRRDALWARRKTPERWKVIFRFHEYPRFDSQSACRPRQPLAPLMAV